MSVRTGQTVARGDVRRRHRRHGPTATEHDGTVLHLGLRMGDRYVDPMLLFRPDDLTKLVHLVPADEPDETPWSPARERRDLQSSLRLPVPGPARDPAHTPTTTTATPTSRSSATPSTRRATSARGSATTPGAAVDAGVGFLDATTDLAADALDDLRSSSLDTVAAMQSLAVGRRERARPHPRRPGHARPRRHRAALRRHRDRRLQR